VSGMSGDGTVVASIAAGVVSDAAGNTNAASTSTDNTVTYDTTAPTVTINQAPAQADPAGAGPIIFRVVFSEPIVAASFSGADVSLGGTAGASTATVSEVAPNDGTTFDVAVSGMTGDGTVFANIDAGAVSDLGGTGNAPSSSTDNTVLYDATAPTVTIDQAPSQADPANAGLVVFEVRFSEPVTGFDGTDVSLSGTAGASTAVVAGSGSSYTVSVSGMASDGTVIASIAAAVASDAAGNPSEASTSTDNSVAYDTTAPTVIVEQAASQADPAATAPISFVAVFSEPVSGFGDADVSLGGTASPSSAAVSELAPNDGTTYAIAVGGMTSAGSVTADIGVAVVSDLAGNSNLASTSADNSVTFDPVAPVVTGIARADSSPTNASSVSFLVTFSGAVTGVDQADFGLTTTGTLGGASVTAVSGSGATRTVTVSSGTGSGTLRLDLVDDDSIVDSLSVPLGGSGSGNGDFNGGQLYAIDRTAPLAAQLSVPAVAEGGAGLTFTVVYSDDVAVSAASLGGDDILVSGPGGFTQAAALVGVSPAGDGTPLTATYRIAAPGGSWDAADNGTYSVGLAGGQVLDALGNAAAATVLGDFSVSISRPVVYRVSLPMIFTGTKPLWEGGTFLRR
jgi:predicted heme/steroid binding protein